jgi:hypothetical protein
MQLDSEVDMDLFDPLDKPGELDKAVLHGNVQKVLYTDNKFKEKNSNIKNLTLANIIYCSCCLLPKQAKNVVKQYSLCVEDKKLTAVGLGAFLYFYFLKFCSLVLFIAFILVCIPQLTAALYYYKNLRSFCALYSVNDSCFKYAGDDSGNWLYLMSYESMRSYKNISTITLASNQALMDSLKIPSEATQDDRTLNLTESSSTTEALVHNNTIIHKVSLNIDTEFSEHADGMSLDFSFLNAVAMIVIFITNLCSIVDCHCYLYEDDESRITPSDYALMMTNVPEIRDKGQLMEFLAIDDEQYTELKDPTTGNILTVESRAVEIKPIDIVYTYKTHELMRLKSKLLDISKKIRACKISGDDLVKGFLCIKKKTIADLEKKRDKIRKRIKERITTKMREYSGVIIAIFNTQTEKDAYLNKFTKSLIKKIFDKILIFLKKKLCKKEPKGRIKTDNAFRKIKVSSAPEPEDILWENIQFTQKDKIKTVLWVYCVSAGLICLSFATIMGITFIQKGVDVKDFKQTLLLSISISLIVTVINGLIKFSLIKLSE